MGRRRLMLCMGILVACLRVQAQDSRALLHRFNGTGEDSNRVNAALELAAYYTDIEEGNHRHTDSAAYFVNIAEPLSRRLQLLPQLYGALRYKAVLKGLNGDLTGAYALVTQVASYYLQAGNKREAAYTWRMYGDCVDWQDVAHAQERRRGYFNAYNIYKTTEDKQAAADLLGKMADADLNLDSLDRAEQEMLETLSEYKALEYTKIYYGYYMLAEIYTRKNLVQLATLAYIECTHAFDQDPNGTPLEGSLYYMCVGSSQAGQKQYQLALDAYLKGIALVEKAGSSVNFFQGLYGACTCYKNLGRHREGLAFLKKKIGRFPMTNPADERSLLMAELAFNDALGNDQRIGELLPMIKHLSSKVYNDALHAPYYYSGNNYVAVTAPLLRYYIRTLRWDKFAEEYHSLQLLAQSSKALTVPIQAVMLQYGYILDSVHGNFEAGWQKYRMMKQITDSVNDVQNTAQINELEARYRSLAKDKQIQALASQASLQNATLLQRNVALRVTTGGTLLLIILAIAMYHAYWTKKRANVRLNEQQNEINAQNGRLSVLLQDKEKLIGEKDELLVEKEWLLREVHHRVKNNLQIVISLLYNQSAYLDNPVAIKAIRDIQNRIQAIAIIHQKLYRKPGANAVLLTEYVQDLIGYLAGAFGPRLRRIRFSQDLEAVALDPAQAVPLGLILNESITNAIKYAFDETGGEICVSGRLADAEHLCVMIADNGRGFGENPGSSTTSLGMEMMKALARQLNGHLEKKNDGGAVIIVTFRLAVQDTTMPESNAIADV